MRKYFFSFVVSLLFVQPVFAQEIAHDTDVPLAPREVVALEQAMDVDVDVREAADGIMIQVAEGVLEGYDAEALAAALGSGVRVTDMMPDQDIVLVEYTSADKDMLTFLTELLMHELVVYAEPNYISEPSFIPNDTRFGTRQWNLHNIEYGSLFLSSQDSDIDAPEAWDVETDNGIEVPIALIDYGVDYTHEDLAANMWDGSAGCKDDTGDVIVGGCPHHGWDFVSNDDDPFEEPIVSGGAIRNIHGTPAAGLFGAVTNNSTGIAGMSRYNKLKIMATRRLSSFSIIRSINFARHNDAKVIVGEYYTPSGGYSSFQEAAIENFDGVFVAAAGNNDKNNDSDPSYPCNYNLSNVICVGASEYDDDLASYSNYGVGSVDIAAPSTGTHSTRPGNTYGYFSGTSAAIPHVGGAAGLVYSEFPDLSREEVVARILDSADIIEGLEGKIADGRRLNLARAIGGDPADEQKPEKACHPETDTDGDGYGWDGDSGCYVDPEREIDEPQITINVTIDGGPLTVGEIYFERDGCATDEEVVTVAEGSSRTVGPCVMGSAGYYTSNIFNDFLVESVDGALVSIDDYDVEIGSSDETCLSHGYYRINRGFDGYDASDAICDFTFIYTGENEEGEEEEEEEEAQASCPADSDHDGDGWGWNGTSGCQVAQDDNESDSPREQCIADGGLYNTELEKCFYPGDEDDEEEEQVACPVDSDHDGDGWGWNGTSGCRVDTDDEQEESEVTDEPKIYISAEIDGGELTIADINFVRFDCGGTVFNEVIFEGDTATLSACTSNRGSFVASSDITPQLSADGSWADIDGYEITVSGDNCLASDAENATYTVAQGYDGDDATDAICDFVFTYTGEEEEEVACPVDSDHDGDGWGWNGTSGCQVDVNEQEQEEEQEEEVLECFDWDGDGWGWDGEKGCRV